MSKPMDHIAYLSQEIGPRPAGTEEEQQAALYITEKLQKEAHLSANIEDFTCSPDPTLPRLICFGVTLLSVVLAIAVPVLSIPAVILTLLAAAAHILESLDKPILSRLFMKGVSQNVVAKYEPTQPSDGSSSRRRKIIVVANYDSGKVRKDLAGPFLGLQKPIQMASLVAMALMPAMLLIRSFLSGGASLFLTVLVVILAVVILVPFVFAVLEKTAAYNESANDNAAGVAVMLEIARRLGTGEASGNADAFQGVLHGEEAAYAADVVPQGATLSYEVEDGASFDIAANLVQGKDKILGSPSEADMLKTRKDTKEALNNLPLGTLAEAAAKAAALESAAEEAEREAALREEIAASKAELEEEARLAEEEAQAEAAARAAAAATAVPDWYRKATQKAHAKADRPADLIGDAASYRSRFADFPTMNDEEPVEELAFEGDIPGDAQPEPVVEEAPVLESLVEEYPADELDIMAQLEAADQDDLAGYDTVDPSVEELFAEPAQEEPVQEEETEQPVELPESQDGEEDVEATEPAASEGSVEEEAAEEPVIDPETAAAATTRLPQMMYYKPPEDRSDVMRSRAQKDRVTVDAGMESQAQPEQRVIVPSIPMVELPEITLPPITAPDPKPISFDELRQRAPLATAAEADSQAAAKELLTTTLPPIEPATFDNDLFGDIQVEVPQNTSISMTGSFAAVSAIGATPVGDELLADVAPEDIYVDDADDTVFQEEFTEMGAFAGPGYVEMPQSRFGKFFSRFRKKKAQEEESATSWLGVDEDFDARSVGKARGGWESFREDDEWEGGAFSSLKARVKRDAGEEASAESERPARNRASQYAVSASAMEDVAAMAAALSGSSQEEDTVKTREEEIKQIYSFAAGDINTEVWFVALGSELANNSGIKAFLAQHESDMRGAVMVNLEALGAGDLCYLEREGYLRQVTCSARMKRFIRKASQASGIDVHTAQIDWKESAASYALKHRMQAMTLAGMDGSKPVGLGEADDVLENIDEAMLDRSADLVVEVLRNI